MSTSEIAKLESRWRENRQGLTFAPLAEAYRKMKEPQRALEILGEGLGLHPDYIPASIVLGRCHLDLGDDGAAEQAFSRVLALDSENVIALKALAEITERHLRFDESENWLRQLLVIDRSNDDARAQLTRVEDSRRNTIGVVRDESGTETEAESVTGEMPGLEPAAMPAAAIADDDTEPVEVADAGHDYEPADAASGHAMELESIADDPLVADAPLLDETSSLNDAPLPLVEASTDAVYTAFDTADVAGPVLDELEPSLDMSDSLVPVQKAEELELRSSGASEFQSPDAAADLAGSAMSGEREPAADLRDFDWTPMSADQEVASESWTEPTAETAWPELEPSGDGAAAWEADAAEQAEVEVEAAESQFDTERAAEPELTMDTPALEAISGSPVAEAPPAAEAAPEVEPVAAAEPDEPAEPEPVVTASMAELYLKQGHTRDALTIYRELYLRHPDDRRLREKVDALEMADAAVASSEPEPEREPEPKPELEDFSAGADGQSVAALFHGLLAARPAAAPTWSPVAPVPQAGTSPADAGAASGSAGEPTRPADDRLSLSAVFGDDSSPVPPAMPAGPGATADGMSFDAFFDAAPPAESAARRPAARDDDDLDQFHAWLQNLKR